MSSFAEIETAKFHANFFDRISKERNENVKLMILLNQVMTINKYLRDPENKFFLNTAIPTKAGQIFIAGMSPKSLADNDDRKKYIEAIERNDEKGNIRDSLIKQRELIRKKIDECIAMLPRDQMKIARSLADQVLDTSNLQSR